MDTSADAPYLDCAYKLVEYAGKARRKRSEGKVLWPGRKQVYRKYENSGRMAGDILSLEGHREEGEPLILPVMRAGKRLSRPVPLSKTREGTRKALERLPEPLRVLGRAPEYPITVSQAVRELAQEIDRIQLQSEIQTGDQDHAI
jgi:nicotinate phosphoribosyltransferase